MCEDEADEIGPIQILCPNNENEFIIDVEIITIPNLASLIGCSVRQIYAAIRMGQLPKPKNFCGQKVWLGSDLKNHIHAYLQQGVANGK